MGGGRAGVQRRGGRGGGRGRALQVDGFKIRFERPFGFSAWKLEYDEALSNLAFNFNLRRYDREEFRTYMTEEGCVLVEAAAAGTVGGGGAAGAAGAAGAGAADGVAAGVGGAAAAGSLFIDTRLSLALEAGPARPPEAKTPTVNGKLAPALAARLGTPPSAGGGGGGKGKAGGKPSKRKRH